MEIQPVATHRKFEPSMGCWKGAKAIVEAGNVEGWGKVL